MKYSVDASTLILIKKRFPPDSFPSLWVNIEKLINDCRLIATEEVYHELNYMEDELFNWVKQHKEMIVPHDEEIQIELRKIINKYKKITNHLKNRDGADPWIIALAVVKNCTVLTEEQGTGNMNKPKIPDVCRDLGINCLNLTQVVKEERWIF